MEERVSNNPSPLLICSFFFLSKDLALQVKLAPDYIITSRCLNQLEDILIACK